MKLAFKKLVPEAILPTYAHEGDAGMDVRSVKECVIPAHGRALIPTGLVALLPLGYEIQVRSRSGLALKKGIAVLNSPGTIDAGYRGEIGVILLNTSDSDFPVAVGDKIAQLVVAPVLRIDVCESTELDSTERGAGGFGSTGVAS